MNKIHSVSHTPNPPSSLGIWVGGVLLERIHEVDTRKDLRPSENDPLISALSEIAVTSTPTKQPDFIVSHGTVEPKQLENNAPTSNPHNLWSNGASPRWCRLS